MGAAAIGIDMATALRLAEAEGVKADIASHLLAQLEAGLVAGWNERVKGER